jgi:osmotically inducible lipoprotein OsmB
MRMSTLAVAALLVVGTSGSAAYADACSGRNHNTGSVLGAVGGGLIGNAMTGGGAVGIVGGAVAGGLAGNAIERDLDCKRGRHYDRHQTRHYWYDRHGHRVYEERRERRQDYERDRDRDYRRDDR